MVDLTWHDYGNEIQSQSPGVLSRVADTAVDAVCNLYYRSPAAFLTNNGGGLELLQGQRSFYDNMCAPKNKVPDLPPTPFNGGQCDAVLYEVQLLIKYKTGQGNPTQVVERETTITDRVWGAITSIYMSDPGNVMIGDSTVAGYQRVQIACRGSGSEGIKPPTIFSPYGGSVPNLQSASIVSATRVDTQPDNCGNPFPRYPDPLLTDDDLRSRPTINISNNVNSPVDVQIIKTYAPTTNIFRPELNINVGGINVNLSLGGITFKPTLEIPINLNFPLTGGGSGSGAAPKPIDGEGSGNGSCDLTPVTQLLNKIDAEVIECCNKNSPFPDPENVGVVVLGNGNSGTADLPAKCFRVEVIITTELGELEVQSGDGGVSVYQAGWVNFIYATAAFPRQPIAAAKNVYDVPERFQGKFAWKMRKDYTCSVICYTSTK